MLAWRDHGFRVIYFSDAGSINQYMVLVSTTAFAGWEEVHHALPYTTESLLPRRLMQGNRVSRGFAGPWPVTVPLNVC
jgi:hypothetical protein